MKILVVAARFWPESAMSATRVTSYVTFLAESGHDVTVVTRLPPVEASRQSQLSGTYRMVRVRDPLAGIERRVMSPAPTQSTESRHRVLASQPAVKARRWVARVLAWPDRFAPWAVLASRALRAESPQVDVVISSGPPLSAILVGAWWARRSRTHHVVEFRDLISIGTYNDSGRLRRWSEGVLEGLAVRRARAAVTVSQPLADDLASVYSTPVTVIQNGYDPCLEVMPRAVAPDPAPLEIAYCGEIYIGRRDPAPLFDALQELARDGTDVRVTFYGSTSRVLERLVRDRGLEGQVSLHGRVSHDESQRIQKEADVLLLLMWNDPREVGVYSGKLYEYIGARRPILMLGYENGVAAELIRERAAGVIANSPREIGAALRRWSEQKSAGGIPTLPAETSAGLSRRDQAALLERLLASVVRD